MAARCPRCRSPALGVRSERGSGSRDARPHPSGRPPSSASPEPRTGRRHAPGGRRPGNRR
ncbi:MAG: hypothetical protein D6729_07785 [Deltaproteobacteria bacterium]|nr:MAG: hypothetical protein D6729_07785 [Deltaproteobacteria bacterium]